MNLYFLSTEYFLSKAIYFKIFYVFLEFFSNQNKIIKQLSIVVQLIFFRNFTDLYLLHIPVFYLFFLNDTIL